MKQNIGKVRGTVRLLCFYLLAVLCLQLSFYLPANATTGYWVLNSNSGYLGLENAGNKNITFTNNSYGVVSFTNNNVADSVWGMFFVAPNATTTSVTSNDDFFVTFAMVWSNPNALSLGHESMAKSCFVSNSQYMAIDDCQVATDTGYNWTGDSRYTEAYIYSIHGHFLQSFGWLPSLNLRFKSAGLIATPSSAINVYITAPVINIYENREVAADQLVAQRAGEIRQDLARMHATLNDIAQNSSNTAVVQQQQQTNQKLDREWEQEQQDRQDFEDTQEDGEQAAQDTADDFNDSSQSLLSAMGTVVGLVRDTPASNCQIPVNDIGPNGVLDLGNVDICNIPNDIKQVINRVFGLVMIIASALLAWNVFNTGIDLFAQVMGYSYKTGDL